MNRQTVFLDEMGLGPQWRLRNASVAAAPAADADAASDAYAVDGAGTVAETVVAVEAFAVTPAEFGAVDVATPDAFVPVSVAVATVVDAIAASVAQAPAEDAAWSNDAPAAAAQAGAHSAAHSAAPGATDSTSSISSTGEDMSWFDDAPAPPAKTSPPLKSAAQARPAAPARPAGPGSSGTSAAPQEESTAWFDDAPAPPARPPRPASPVAPSSASSPAAAPRAKSSPASSSGPDFSGFADSMDMPVFDADPDAWLDVGIDLDDRAPAGVSDAAIARMDSAALQAAVQGCTRCGLCRTRQTAVPGQGAANAAWMVVATAPGAAEEQAVQPVAGEAAILLDNMLKAIGAGAESGTSYVTTLVKCRPLDAQGADRAPTPEELAACRPYLERELALTGARTILTLGHTAGKGLLGAAARGKVLRLGDVPVVATYHPADLLRKPEDKRKVWADLCLTLSAAASVQEGGQHGG